MVTVADKCDALRVHVLAREQQIKPATHIDHRLHHVSNLLLVQRFVVCHVTRTRDWPIGQKRHHVHLRQRNRFIEKLFTIAHRRVLPIPMAPNHSRERPFSFRHDEISGHDTTFRTGISDVVDNRVLPLLRADLLHFDRCLLIVIKMTKHLGILREHATCPSENDPDPQNQLRNDK